MFASRCLVSSQWRIQDDFDEVCVWVGGGGGGKGVLGVDLIKLRYFTYSERQAWANSVDPDQAPQNAASDQGLHCLPLIKQF